MARSKKRNKKTSKRRSYKRKKRNGPVTDSVLKLAGAAALAGGAYYGYKSYKGRLAPPEGATLVKEEVVDLPDGTPMRYIIWSRMADELEMFGYSVQDPKESFLDIPEVTHSDGGYMTAEAADLAVLESLPG